MRKINVLLLTRYSRSGSSSRLRFYQYLPALNAESINVTIAPLLSDGYIDDLYSGRKKSVAPILSSYLRRIRDVLKSKQFDVLWIEKEIIPWAPAWAEAILARLKVPYVVDYDDATFHAYDTNTNPVIRRLLNKKIDHVMKNASLVVAGNEYIAERARTAGARRIEWMPTVIDLNRYPLMQAPPNQVFTIGWIGAPVTARYLELVQPALAEICKDGNARLVLVGAGNIKLSDVPTKALCWSEETEVSEIQGFNVGIMPLANNHWERGKCGYKLIQYMACAKPIVASPIGINQRIVAHGVNGFLASTKEDWVEALRELRDKPALQETMGKAGRAQVEKRYCLQVTAADMAALLRSVVIPDAGEKTVLKKEGRAA
ncbi:MAG TPA: glycosyltransferase family 4 protein [Candidatus Aquicultor sp.]|jgi:glycosyltransferase involved in cell wall biosynthesis